MAQQKPKTEHPVGKIYRIQEPEIRLKHGELRLVIERRFQKIYQHAPLWVNESSIEIYPEALWYSDELRGDRTVWQPSSREFHLLLAGVMVPGAIPGRHPLAQELLGPMPFVPSSPMPMRTVQGGD